MNFSSDTAAPAHPAVLEALLKANTGAASSYGADKITQRLRGLLAQVFETEEFDFWLVSSGTAANALALACFCPPTSSIICHREAHIQMDERGAPEFFTGGGKLHLMDGEGAKLDFAPFNDYLDEFDPRFVHATPPAVLSLTNLTECGRAYTPAEIAKFSQRARYASLAVHLDGARLGNALAHTGATPAEMTWKAGVDVLTLGLTKTGAIGCEIILLFGAAKSKGRELQARAKRAGHMPAKMRFLAAQAEAMLTDGLWLRLSAHANAMAQRVAAAFIEDGHDLAWPVEGNEVFVNLDEQTFNDLQEDGAQFYEWPGGSHRFVCSWATTDKDIADLIESLSRPLRR